MNGLLPVSLMPGAPTPVTREIERVVSTYMWPFGSMKSGSMTKPSPGRRK